MTGYQITPDQAFFHILPLSTLFCHVPISMANRNHFFGVQPLGRCWLIWLCARLVRKIVQIFLHWTGNSGLESVRHSAKIKVAVALGICQTRVRHLANIKVATSQELSKMRRSFRPRVVTLDKLGKLCQRLVCADVIDEIIFLDFSAWPLLRCKWKKALISGLTFSTY